MHLTVIVLIILFKTAYVEADEVVNSDESNSEADFLLRTGTILLRNEGQKTKNEKSYTHNSSIESVVQECDYMEINHSAVSLISFKKKYWKSAHWSCFVLQSSDRFSFKLKIEVLAANIGNTKMNVQ